MLSLFNLALVLLFLQIASITAFPLDSLLQDSSAIARRGNSIAPRQDVPAINSLPDYVLQYAPVMYLHSQEQWFPTDVKSFLENVTPLDSSGSPVNASASDTPTTFALLSTFSDPSATYLSSIQDTTTLPDPSWLNSQDGRPDESKNGSSSAPVEIIVAPKDGGIVDVFYFFFFAYNEGPEVLGTSFGNHVGDWEHTMIRFQDGTPQAIYLSQHDSGIAYTWDAIIKNEQDRPSVYIALGDHACYAMPGTHTYEDILSDQTDVGTLWDITLNYRAYSFDSVSGQFAYLNVFTTTSASTATLASSNSDSMAASASTFLSGTSSTFAVSFAAGEDTDEDNEGVDWLKFVGYWGDKQFPDSDPRQTCLFGHCRFTDGPLGPYLKNLGRQTVCQDDSNCDINQTL